MTRTLQIIGLLCILFIVSACQADTEQEVNNNADENQETTEENESDTGTSADNNTDTSYEYEEQEVIGGQIDEGDYDVVVETDNQGTRVMFYEIDGEKYYKTIFVKDDNRLKIIDIQNDNGLIYNETI